MYLQKFEVKNKTALVTGAGNGIGKASAIALAEAGANLIILSRTEKDLLQVETKIKKLKRKCKFFACDVSNYKDVKKCFNQISNLDILVNNAGTNRPEYFAKIGISIRLDLLVDTFDRRYSMTEIDSKRIIRRTEPPFSDMRSRWIDRYEPYPS